MMAPVIEEIAREFAGKVEVKKINVDSGDPLVFQYGIQSIPTLVLLKDNQTVRQWVGVRSKEELVKAIEEVAAL